MTKSTRNFLISNFGDESIALIQWAHEHAIGNMEVISVETGWAAPEWETRIQQAQIWLDQLSISHTRLTPPADFQTLIQTQGKFPSRKFQWCANFLKALPILDYLDQVDPLLDSQILLARRRLASRANLDLPEFIADEPKWGDRTVWHPLYLYSQSERDALIQKTPFSNSILNHRSLECDPCVNSDLPDLLRMDLSVIERTADLEKKLNAKFLEPDLYHQAPTLDLAFSQIKSDPFSKHPTSSGLLFDMGCGNTFGCGL